MSLEVFQKDVGVWDATIEVFAGPAPSTSTGTMTNRMACNGTWLVSDYVGDSGQFSGHGMWTFDKTKNKFVGVWADNMMQFLAPGEGSWDGRVMTFFYDAKIGDKAMRWKQTTEQVDKDTQVFLSFMPDTAEKPMMKATYKRRK